MSKRILFIEDDVVLGDVLRDKLTLAGYEVTVTTDGALGLNQIRELKPDLVLLDIMLPSMNGYEILEAKFQDPLIKDIPVIIVSNSGQPVEISRALALGVKDYFVKAQFNPDEILEKVRTHMPIEPSAEGALKGKKILSVEDDKFLSDVMLKKMSDEACTVLHTTSGEEALVVAEKEQPDVILLDLVLPGMNGFEILKRFKDNPTTKQIPVIILSNLGQKEDIDKAMAGGAVKFLVKAMTTPDQIVTEVRQVLVRS